MTVGMLLATILLVLTFSGVLSGAWERLGIRPRTAGAWLLAMLTAALLMPDVRLGAARVNPAGLAVTAAASVRLMMTIRPRRELVRVLLGSVIAGAMGLLVLILSDGRGGCALGVRDAHRGGGVLSGGQPARDAPVQLDGAARRAGRSGRVGGYAARTCSRGRMRRCCAQAYPPRWRKLCAEPPFSC